jgi:bisphosphoglycerate-dependent phosphoglycerate mutase
MHVQSGMEEAHRAAKNLIDEGFTFDIMYTSVLQVHKKMKI